MKLVKNIDNNFPIIFDDFFETDLWRDPNNLFSLKKFTTGPAINIAERKNEFQIDFAVPGMKKDDFQIKLEANMLTISCEKEFEKEEKEENYSRREFGFNKFSRSFNLPEYVKKEDIYANYEEGILKIFVPKQEEMKARTFKEVKIS